MVSKNGAFLFLVDVSLCLVMSHCVTTVVPVYHWEICGCQDLVSAQEADGICLAVHSLTVQSHDATVSVVYLVMKLLST